MSSASIRATHEKSAKALRSISQEIEYKKSLLARCRRRGETQLARELRYELKQLQEQANLHRLAWALTSG